MTGILLLFLLVLFQMLLLKVLTFLGLMTMSVLKKVLPLSSYVVICAHTAVCCRLRLVLISPLQSFYEGSECLENVVSVPV